MEVKNTGGQLISEQIDAKLAEFIAIVENTELDYTDKRRIQHRINMALRLAGTAADENPDNLQQFFSGHKTDTRTARKDRAGRMAASIMRILTSLLLIGLGFGMIIMPAPAYFEMFTLFTIPGSNGNDGVTIMDVISLIVAFSGVSLLISAIIKFNK